MSQHGLAGENVAQVEQRFAGLDQALLDQLGLLLVAEKLRPRLPTILQFTARFAIEFPLVKSSSRCQACECLAGIGASQRFGISRNTDEGIRTAIIDVLG